MYISDRTLQETSDGEYKIFLSLLFQTAAINIHNCTFPSVSHEHIGIYSSTDETSLICKPAFDLMYYVLFSIKMEGFFLNIYFTTPGGVPAPRLKGDNPFDTNKPPRNHFLMLYSLFIVEKANEIFQEDFTNLYNILRNSDNLQFVIDNLERVKLLNC